MWNCRLPPRVMNQSKCVSAAVPSRNDDEPVVNPGKLCGAVGVGLGGRLRKNRAGRTDGQPSCRGIESRRCRRPDRPRAVPTREAGEAGRAFGRRLAAFGAAGVFGQPVQDVAAPFAEQVGCGGNCDDAGHGRCYTLTWLLVSGRDGRRGSSSAGPDTRPAREVDPDEIESMAAGAGRDRGGRCGRGRGWPAATSTCRKRTPRRANPRRPVRHR